MNVLLKSGAHFLPDDTEVLRELCIAASKNDIESLRLWKSAQVDLNMTDVDERTPLHFVSCFRLCSYVISIIQVTFL